MSITNIAYAILTAVTTAADTQPTATATAIAIPHPTPAPPAAGGHAQTGPDPAVVHQLLNEDLVVPLVAITGGLTIAAIAIIGGMISGTMKNRQREQTRREIAAYVAEGSITSDEGERLMEAGVSKDS